MAAPTLVQIRDAIYTVLASVDEIGKTHKYERYADDNAGLLDKYAYTPTGENRQVRGWFIRRSQKSESSTALGRNTAVNTWIIAGYMALQDAAISELAFDDVVEAVCDAFRADETLGGVVDSTVVDDAAGVQIDESGPLVFAGVLCHGATLRLMTRHYLDT